jgi:hypothetical protein
MQQGRALFDHFVGCGEERRRQVEAQMTSKPAGNWYEPIGIELMVGCDVSWSQRTAVASPIFSSMDEATLGRVPTSIKSAPAAMIKA